MLECIARPRAIYIIGDSVTAVFTDRVYRAPGDARSYIARTKYLPGLTVAAFADEGGALHPDVMTALTSECIIVPDEDGALKSIHRAESRAWRYAAATMGRPRRSPVVVLMCGGLDVAQILYELGPGADFELETVVAKMDGRIAALERGLRALHGFGLEDVLVHSISPLNPDDEAFAGALGFFRPVALRYEVQLLFNARLAACCARAGAAFLDLWPDTMDGTAVRPEFVLDPLHFNARGALLTMQRVVAHIGAAREDAAVPAGSPNRHSVAGRPDRDRTPT